MKTKFVFNVALHDISRVDPEVGEGDPDPTPEKSQKYRVS